MLLNYQISEQRGELPRRVDGREVPAQAEPLHLPEQSFPLPTRQATRRLAERLAPFLRASDLVILTGPLAAGKTFFVRALCRALGVPREQRVTSPTFALIHELSGRVNIAHADLYRLRNAHELEQLGLDALRDDGSLLLVEWGQPYARELGGDALLLALSLEPRVMHVTPSGSRSNEIAAALAQTDGKLDASGAPR